MNRTFKGYKGPVHSLGARGIRGVRTASIHQRGDPTRASTSENSVVSSDPTGPAYYESISSSVDESTQPSPSSSPPSVSRTLADILKLAIPSLGTVLIDPLMSLVDTACVGHVSTIQLAAMGPCTSIFGCFFMIFYFLNTSTCNYVGREEDPKRASEAVSNALSICALCSVVLLCIILPFGPQLLAAVGASPEIAATALPYLQIRALAAPAVLLSFVLSGLFLAKLETRIPFRVAVISGVLNLVGDIFLVLPRFLDMGIAGAALATTVSQYVAAIFMWTAAQDQAKGWGLDIGIKGLPTWQAIVDLTRVGWALISRSLFMMACYTGLTGAATLLGAIPLAAHQVALQAWWFISTVCEPVLLAAQALLTRETRGAPLGLGLSPSAQTLARLILVIGLGVAVMLSGLTVGVFAGLPWVFSQDVNVQLGVKSIALQGAISQLLICCVMALDGITIGLSNWNHLQLTNFTSMVVTLTALHLMQTLQHASLGNVWWILTLFCAVRLLSHVLYYTSKLIGGPGSTAPPAKNGDADQPNQPPPAAYA